MDYIYHIEQVDLKTEERTIVGIATDMIKAKTMRNYLLDLHIRRYEYQIKVLKTNRLSIDHKFVNF